MRVLLLLYTACLLRRCHCGDEPKVLPGPPNDDQNVELAATGGSEQTLDECLPEESRNQEIPILETDGSYESIVKTKKPLDLQNPENAPQINTIPINTAKAEWDLTNDEQISTKDEPDSPKDGQEDESSAMQLKESIITSLELLQAEAVRPMTPTGQTLDIAKLNPTLCNLHEYYYDDNHIALIVPKRGIIVTKFIQSKFPIWEGKDGESCEFSKLYLNKSNKPDLLLIAKRDTTGLSSRWYAKYFGVWIKYKTPDERITKLRIPIERNINFIMNMEDSEDTSHCTIFDTLIFGAPLRLYFAKPGYYSSEVINGDEEIWRAEGDERCMASDLYSKNFEPFLVILSIRNGDIKSYKHFERRDGEWKEITDAEFFKIRDEITNIQLTNRSSADIMITPPISPSSSRHTSFDYTQQENIGATNQGKFKKMWNEKKQNIKRLSKRFPSKEMVATYVGRKVNTLGNKMESFRKHRRSNIKPITTRRDSTDDCTLQANTSPSNHLQVNTSPSHHLQSPDGAMQGLPLVVSVSSTLDISKLDEEMYNSYFHYGDAIPTMLVLPKNGVSILTIVDDGEEIWKAEDGKALDYIKIYINSENRQEVIFIMSSSSKSTEKKYYRLLNDEWIECSETYLDALRITTETIVEIDIDIDKSEDTENCTIFDAKIYGVPFRSYIPKLGFHAIRVSSGEKTIWSANDGEVYISSTSYLRDGEPVLLLLKIANHEGKTQRCYEKDAEGEWKSVDKHSFDRKRYELAC